MALANKLQSKIMLLKKIEINGFKSFARKTTLNFFETKASPQLQDENTARNFGITAIVGPNGSGKSNVADALKWVLGEQSMKNLRGKKSSDIIFAGSDNKSRLGSAQVSIFLDNSDKQIPLDYEEVIISRKVYQDGENEYLINGSRVRLSDLLELLAKAGVGQRSYAIVNQGMADKLLQAGPLEKRAMLEEAAGVKSYQLKKEKSQRKLKSTIKNLERVDELLAEIEPHLRLLKRQYNKMQKGENYLQELTEKQTKLYSFLWKQLQSSRQELSQQAKNKEKEIESLQKDIEELSQRIKQESVNAVSYKEEISGLEKKKRALAEELNKIEKELVVNEGRLELEEEKLRQLSAIKEIPVNLDFVKDKIVTLKKKQKQFLQRIISQDKKIDLNYLQGEAEKILQDLEGLYQALRQGKITEKKISPELASQKEKSEREISLRKQKIAINQKEKENLLEKIEKISQKIDALIKKENRERRTAIELEDKLRRLRFNIDQLKNQLNESKIELAKLEVREEDLRRQILSELKKEPERLVATHPNLTEKEIPAYSERIYWLKSQLDQIGGIDPEVIKEYKETQARYDFLHSESEDLKVAMKKLRKVIEEMDKQIKKRFSQTFRAINKEFQHYFKIIFNGGTAKLEQVEIESRRSNNEEEIDSKDEEKEREIQIGVEVVANPPGKKISSLGMLSGGEKTLTSLALLFAIISHNPPPFVLLDEVEAALDEANSQRFGRILRELSKKTQFIIITHNRQTMKTAEAIYGVSMSDDGVSNLLSIKLEGAQEYAK